VGELARSCAGTSLAAAETVSYAPVADIGILAKSRRWQAWRRTLRKPMRRAPVYAMESPRSVQAKPQSAISGNRSSSFAAPREAARSIIMRMITIIAADGRRHTFGGHGRLNVSKRLLAFWLGQWPSCELSIGCPSGPDREG